MLPILSVELMEAPVEAVESPQAGAQMVRQAYKLVVDLMKPKPWVYWTDLLVVRRPGLGHPADRRQRARLAGGGLFHRLGAGAVPRQSLHP